LLKFIFYYYIGISCADINPSTFERYNGHKNEEINKFNKVKAIPLNDCRNISNNNNNYNINNNNQLLDNNNNINNNIDIDLNLTDSEWTFNLIPTTRINNNTSQHPNKKSKNNSNNKDKFVLTTVDSNVFLYQSPLLGELEILHRRKNKNLDNNNQFLNNNSNSNHFLNNNSNNTSNNNNRQFYRIYDDSEEIRLVSEMKEPIENSVNLNSMINVYEYGDRFINNNTLKSKLLQDQEENINNYQNEREDKLNLIQLHQSNNNNVTGIDKCNIYNNLINFPFLKKNLNINNFDNIINNGNDNYITECESHHNSPLYSLVNPGKRSENIEKDEIMKKYNIDL
jgi:hypothetical protein